MEIVISLVLFVVLVSAGIGLRNCFKILYPKMKTEEFFDEVLNKYNQYDKKWYESLDKNEFYIKSKFGYDLNVTYIKNEIPTEHTIIICHGVTVRTRAVIKYLNMFLKNGYNAVFIDHRAHGKSGGKKVSYGYFEKHDLAQVIQWVRKQHNGKIGLIGESMGAGISMQTLLVETVDFVIEDCGYSSLDEEVKHQFRNTKYVPTYPGFWFTRLFVRLFGGYDINKTSPVEAVKQSDVPIMVVHGEKDNYVPFYMASIIYENIKSEQKMLYVAEGSKHAVSYEEHPDEYQQQVYKFLKICGMPYAEDFVA